MAILIKPPNHNPEMRDLPVGEAVKAMGRNGLGFINQALYLVPRFFHNKPTSRLISPRVTPASSTMMPSVQPWIPSINPG